MADTLTVCGVSRSDTPRSGAALTTIEPPCNSVKSRAKARPIAVPPNLVLWVSDLEETFEDGVSYSAHRHGV
jgi:hypothetical protein